MSVFPGTLIPTGKGSSDGYKRYIDEYLTPRLMSFRMIHIYDEPSVLLSDRTNWGTTFGNWLEPVITSKHSPLTVRKNGQVLLPVQITDVDYVNGTYQAGAIEMGADGKSRDTLEATYVFDYFPKDVLEGLLKSAVSIVNMTAVGPPTSYTIDTAPAHWAGVITDVAFAMCMEKLLLDYDLWRYRLVFAISPGDLESGGGDITGQLTTLKQNAEQRANQAMQNEKFKVGNYLAPPTAVYFASIRGGGGMRGAHGVPFLGGRLRGWKPTKLM